MVITKESQCCCCFVERRKKDHNQNNNDPWVCFLRRQDITSHETHSILLVTGSFLESTTAYCTVKVLYHLLTYSRTNCLSSFLASLSPSRCFHSKFVRCAVSAHPFLLFLEHEREGTGREEEEKMTESSSSHHL